MASRDNRPRRNHSQSQAYHQHQSPQQYQQQTEDTQTEDAQADDTETEDTENDDGLDQYYQDYNLPLDLANLPKTKDEINLLVAQKQYPSVKSILRVAPYVVLYNFDPTAKKEEKMWQEQQVAGPMFVCDLVEDPALPGARRFALIIMNQKNLRRFAKMIEKSQDVEVTDSIVILLGRELITGAEGYGDAQGPSRVNAHGVWISTESGGSLANKHEEISQVINECAAVAEASRVSAGRSMIPDQATASHPQRHQGAPVVPPMGQQLDLGDLFRKHKAQQNEYAPTSKGNPSTAFFRDNSPYNVAMAMGSALSQLSLDGNHASQSAADLTGQDLLAEMFRKASIR
ncbi:hypothetical protein NA57DRAFT_79561 [Rhizodiscina lignyota]|uniref:PH domain-like protein n=1 Tax=Rhizodiscina lignyota TaxID=1504668 RepID=A0A9P4I7U7_9PEZI|nr:hypothetical protein NA57DRAFT_79561 [Rhizodiscina lignyota]